ncbi:cationic amino acid transporter 4-like isoform X5 [Dermacentor variabilis]|uniref:cationic amino acid transporter 4-like isoform X5 n=1 Tax=Dermacentor variabilis TaxID=34621 RepID=UPI003F5B63FA
MRQGGAGKMLSTFLHKLRRTKEPGADHMQTSLKRCLTTFDITLLGIGHMMGSGIYVLTPSVAKNIAGPALIVSYIVAGVASLLAALAYAEFGVRFPRAGSAYSYSYFSVGEFWAFFVGWNVVLENVIGISAVARACSAYIDSLTHGAIKGAIMNTTGEMPGPYLSPYPDFLALGIIVVYVAFMSVGVQATSWLNNILCCVNIFVLFIIIGVGGYYADFNNWSNPETGGFMPFGVHGILAASAACFFAYVGFDAIAASGEEAKNPQRSLPIATFISMTVVTVLYVAVSAVLTLMVNYKDIVPDSGLPDALEDKGAVWAKIVVIIGALCGMSTVLIGTLYALTRIAYAMADDGLIMHMFGTVNKRTKIPLIAMYVFSALAGLLAVILDIETLVEMMSIGTLFAYLVVSGGIIIFRYREPAKKEVLEMGSLTEKPPANGSSGGPAGATSNIAYNRLLPRFQFMSSVLGGVTTDLIISLSVCGIVVVTLVLGFYAQSLWAEISAGVWWAVLVLVVLVLVLLALCFLISIHEQVVTIQRYKMPFVPFLPILSIVVNTILLTTLHGLTWLRLLVWVAIGLTGYFVYGTQHSKLNKPQEQCYNHTADGSATNGKPQQQTSSGNTAPSSDAFRL